MQNSKIAIIMTGLMFFSFPVFGEFDFLEIEGVDDDSTASDTADTQTNTADEKQNTEIAEDNSDDFFGSYIDDVETQEKAVISARRILQQKPKILTLRQRPQFTKKAVSDLNKDTAAPKNSAEENQADDTTTDPQKDFENEDFSDNILSMQQLQERRKQAEEQVKAQREQALIEQKQAAVQQKREELKEKLTPAPFGLYWDATMDEIKELGFELKPAARKDYEQVYQVTNVKQQSNNFRDIIAIFGVDNHLWCIFAQGNLLDDDARASKVLDLYHKYYKALEQKYGNAHQYFTPYKYEEELIEGEGENQKTTVVTHENPLGGDNFLRELQEGKAFLYATFENGTIGATLGVSVDGSGKSYISLDYKNLRLMNKEQNEGYNRLLEDI
jgi:hypothetical protein